MAQDGEAKTSLRAAHRTSPAEEAMDSGSILFRIPHACRARKTPGKYSLVGSIYILFVK